MVILVVAELSLIVTSVVILRVIGLISRSPHSPSMHHTHRPRQHMLVHLFHDATMAVHRLLVVLAQDDVLIKYSYTPV